MKLILDTEEIRALSLALGLGQHQVTEKVPAENADVVVQFAFIGWLLERVRASCGFGIDVTLVGRESARDLPGHYMASGCSPDGISSISPVISNRGPAAVAAIAVIRMNDEWT